MVWVLATEGDRLFQCGIVLGKREFCSGIQLYILFNPYLYFISFLYLDLYVLGDDSWISKGSLMRTIHLCIFIHIRIKGEVGNITGA